MLKMIQKLCFCLIVTLLSCNEEEPLTSKTPEKESEISEERASSTGKVEPPGYNLTYNGDGRWYGALAGSPIWFWGPTPTQLQNGVTSEWPVAPACSNPNNTQNCYPDGYVVWGNGSYFTVQNPGCATLATNEIPMRKLIRTDNPPLDVIDPSDTYEYGDVIVTVKTFTSGNCSIFTNAKIIIDANCRPLVVTPDSATPPPCNVVPEM